MRPAAGCLSSPPVSSAASSDASLRPAQRLLRAGCRRQATVLLCVLLCCREDAKREGRGCWRQKALVRCALQDRPNLDCVPSRPAAARCPLLISRWHRPRDKLTVPLGPLRADLTAARRWSYSGLRRLFAPARYPIELLQLQQADEGADLDSIPPSLLSLYKMSGQGLPPGTLCQSSVFFARHSSDRNANDLAP